MPNPNPNPNQLRRVVKVSRLTSPKLAASIPSLSMSRSLSSDCIMHMHMHVYVYVYVCVWGGGVMQLEE
jgi:hypothetical protein